MAPIAPALQEPPQGVASGAGGDRAGTGVSADAVKLDGGMPAGDAGGDIGVDAGGHGGGLGPSEDVIVRRAPRHGRGVPRRLPRRALGVAAEAVALSLPPLSGPTAVLH